MAAMVLGIDNLLGQLVSQAGLSEQLQFELDAQAAEEEEWWNKQKSGKGKKPKKPSNKGLERQIEKEFPAEEKPVGGDGSGGAGSGVGFMPVSVGQTLLELAQVAPTQFYPSAASSGYLLSAIMQIEAALAQREAMMVSTREADARSVLARRGGGR